MASFEQKFGDDDEFKALKSSFEQLSDQYLKDYLHDLVDEGSYVKAQTVLALLIERAGPPK